VYGERLKNKEKRYNLLFSRDTCARRAIFNYSKKSVCSADKKRRSSRHIVTDFFPGCPTCHPPVTIIEVEQYN